MFTREEKVCNNGPFALAESTACVRIMQIAEQVRQEVLLKASGVKFKLALISSSEIGRTKGF